jgi:hypothetical protein
MTSDVTVQGVVGQRPGREAMPGRAMRSPRQRRAGEELVVADAHFQSYYGLPVLKQPVWHSPDIPGYLFLGGLAAGSSLLAAGAQLCGLDVLAKRSKLVAAGGASLSAVALVHDLGKPSRFFNMLRVLKPTSPMSVGSWLLAGFGPAAGVAALGVFMPRWARPTSTAATAVAAGFAPFVAAYTGALLSDTAVPIWHEAFEELPVVFVGSAAMAAGGMGLVNAPMAQAFAARRLATFGWAIEAASSERMERRLGMLAEPYRQGRAGRWFRAGKLLGAVGTAGVWLGRRNRAASAIAGAALVASSLCTRFGVFHAGFDSANDPKYTVIPQRQTLSRVSG